jgi:hypothetical protein
MPKKNILFFASGLVDVQLQKIIIEGLALNYKVYLAWTPETNCNSECHPESGQIKNTPYHPVDLGHVDNLLIPEIHKVLKMKRDELIFVSVNQAIAVSTDSALIIINLPTLHGLPRNMISELINQKNKTDSLTRQALVVTNMNDAKLSLQLFQKMFTYYEVINLDYDQIDSRIRIPKSEVSKIYSLIENLK